MNQQLLQVQGLLHALYWLHWTAHWQAEGDYARHLLFQRLYEAIPDQLDILSEKMVQMYGARSVNPIVSASIMNLWLSKWMGAQAQVSFAIAYAAEQDLQSTLTSLFSAMEADGRLSMGMNDYIMSLANEHETHLYLLQQQMKSRTAQETAEKHFFDQPRNREVREFARSNATSNVSGVGVQSLKEVANDGKSVAQERKDERKAPPTPVEVSDKEPGGKQFSTLSRYVVETEQPTDRSVPQGLEETPRHPKLRLNR